MSSEELSCLFTTLSSTSASSELVEESKDNRVTIGRELRRPESADGLESTSVVAYRVCFGWYLGAGPDGEGVVAKDDGEGKKDSWDAGIRLMVEFLDSREGKPLASVLSSRSINGFMECFIDCSSGM